MKKRVYLLAASIAISFSVTAWVNSVPQERLVVCKDVDRSLSSTWQIDNDQITLTSAGKEAASFVNTKEKMFRFGGIPDDMGYALIEVQKLEEKEFLFVHCQSGKTTELKGRPVFSPDRRRFVTASGNEAGFSETALEIFDIAGGMVTLDISMTPDGGGWPDNPKWVDATTFEYDVFTAEGFQGAQRVRRTKDRWRIVSPPS